MRALYAIVSRRRTSPSKGFYAVGVNKYRPMISIFRVEPALLMRVAFFSRVLTSRTYDQNKTKLRVFIYVAGELMYLATMWPS